MIILLTALLLQADAPPQAAPPPEEPPNWSFGGSLFVNGSALGGTTDARDSMEEEGIIGEFAAHVTGRVTDKLTVRARACFGCHGLEVDQAYADYALTDVFSIRAGRFNVPFGGYSGRHDPVIREGSANPAPYAMGLMPRGVEFNYGIVPAPFVDNGISLRAELESASLEVYGVRGLKGVAVDFDYEASRDFEDTNGEPAVGARLEVTVADITLGISGAWGRYNDFDIFDTKLDYLMGGVHARTTLGPLRLRGEFLMRETEYLVPGPPRVEDDFDKVGYALEAAWSFNKSWSGFIQHDALEIDGLYLRPGNTPTPTFMPGVTTEDDTSEAVRVAGGLAYRIDGNFIIKASAEYWDFSDFDDTWVFHVGTVVHY